MTEEKTVYCPSCGLKLRRVDRLVNDYKKGMGISEYGMYCFHCEVDITVEDRSSFEQEGKIIITFT